MFKTKLCLNKFKNGCFYGSFYFCPINKVNFKSCYFAAIWSNIPVVSAKEHLLPINSSKQL